MLATTFSIIALFSPPPEVKEISCISWIQLARHGTAQMPSSLYSLGYRWLPAARKPVILGLPFCLLLQPSLRSASHDVIFFFIDFAHRRQRQRINALHAVRQFNSATPCSSQEAAYRHARRGSLPPDMRSSFPHRLSSMLTSATGSPPDGIRFSISSADLLPPRLIWIFFPPLHGDIGHLHRSRSDRPVEPSASKAWLCCGFL